MVFEKTLTDVVKGIRASKRDTALYISSCIAEIKTEINSTDPHTKANALQKLTFLQMMGYNMSYASFATIEVMSNPRFAFKRIGYLAASQAFTQDTDVVLLTTNTLKKELRGAVGPGMNGVYEAGLAINCLSNIVTTDLARDLLSDVTNLTVHPQPYLRKKAILCLLKMFMKYPQGLRLTFSNLQDSLLKDINPSVTSCAVNVITELSDKNPKNYLVLAPSFFALLTTTSNNWMLIKVVKLLGSLVPEEPRLARKLLDPLASIVQNTQAKSLLYEAVYTITLCLPYCQKSDGSMPSNVPSIVSLCAKTLKSFIQEPDQNLKYLGLVGFASLMISHPKVLAESDCRALILACLSDDDVTIRTRALDLLIGVATRRNVMELVTQLLHHVDLATGSYKIDLVVKIIEICSSDKYSLLTDFVWYMDVLVILALTKGIENTSSGGGQSFGRRQFKGHHDLGPLISGQILDITLRVLPVRTYAVRRMISVLLQDGKDANANSHHNSLGTFGMTTTANMMPELLPAAAWIVGEYALLIDDALAMSDENDNDNDELLKYDLSSMGTYHAIIQALTDPSNIDSTSPTTQSIYIQAAMKVLAAASAVAKCIDSELEACISSLSIYLPVYMQSMDTEVQERAFTAFKLLESFGLLHNSSCESEVVPSMKLLDKDDNDDDTSESIETSKNLSILISSGGTVEKLRNASTTLKYLYIPEQMKPISTKAQKKKRQSAPTSIKNALDQPINVGVFSKLLQGDKSRVNGKRSVEAVSFTQQQPLQISSRDDRTKSMNLMEGLGPDHITLIPETTPAQATLTTSTSLNHPFYLGTNETNEKNEQESAHRFGAIQLLENDSSDSEGHTTKKKKRKKRDKRRKNKIVDEDEHIFGTNGKSKSPPKIMMDSDDEEDDDGPSTKMFHGKMTVPSKRQLETLDSLAQIDLTTPLRDDETMPTMQHRVVPDRQVIEETLQATQPQKKKKAKKVKSVKAKKVKNPSDSIGDTNVQSTADLLDFGGISGNQALSSEKNPVNSAFDDLLSLDMVTNQSVSNLILSDQQIVNSPKASSKRPKVWMEATIKASKAEGKTLSLDWDDVKVLYRIHSSKDEIQNNQVSLILKILNSGNEKLRGIQVKLREGSHICNFDDIEPGSFVESKKLGPLPVESNSYVHEIRGYVTLFGSTAPLKLLLPSFHLILRPMTEISQESVSNMLGSGQWSSSSAKLDISGSLPHGKMRNILKSFLQAHDLEFGQDSHDLNRIFASQITNRAKVLVLIKSTNNTTIKADIKSTDKELAKAISSSIKRLLM